MNKYWSFLNKMRIIRCSLLASRSLFFRIRCSLFPSFLIQICWRFFFSFFRSTHLLMHMNFVSGVQLVILYFICIADYFCDLQYIQRIYVVPIVSHVFRTFVSNRQNHIEYAHCAQFICIIRKCEWHSQNRESNNK